MRLDKYISKAVIVSRTAATSYIRSGRVTVNGTIVKTPDFKTDENTAVVTFDGNILEYNEFIYLMMNKPSGVLSATEDGKGTTVLDLIDEKYMNTGIFPVGRLDKDTVGLLILTNNGPLAHNLLSPKHHVSKSYYLETESKISDADIQKLENGVKIDSETVTMPAKFEVGEDRKSGVLTICEGKFHQIKRMLEAVGNKVVFLKRITFGGIPLDETLSPGEYRNLTKDEIEKLMAHG